ncbi:TPA: hypothetical protein R7376_005088 [Pseudomonas aeruginosa]|nr:hypothetical protein [Pseudomonas aeruginosa]HEE6747601.1 hypothetical protein [Pseudomonas aeruginosa]HEE6759076.1 hypothetical protein [Pseudomonas aeruginosa]
MNTYPERLPALLNIGAHAAQSRFEYILCKGLVDEFGDAGLSIELYVIQDAIEALALADCEHGCDSGTSSILQYYGLVERYQKARRKEEHLSR